MGHKDSLNRFYRIIWNEAIQNEAAFERVKGRSCCTSTSAGKRNAIGAMLFALSTVLLTPVALAYTSVVNGGVTVQNETVGAGGLQTVNSKGHAIGTMVDGEWGQQTVNLGGLSTNTTIKNGGVHYVYGSAIGSIVTSGWQVIWNNASATNTLVNGGQHTISGGGLATGSIVNSGQMGINGNGQAMNTTVNGGELYVGAAGADVGVATNSTINGRGELHVVSGGIINGTTIINDTATMTGVDLAGIVISGGKITNNGTLILNQSVDRTLGAELAGTGSLVKNGNNTLTLTGVSTYSGTTTITGGIFQLDGSHNGSGAVNVQGGRLVVGSTAALSGAQIHSNVSAQNGGVVGGYGHILGQVTLNNGATIAPGNSVGSITLDSLTANAGSAYEVEANVDGSADKINITGTATLNGGGVNVMAGGGNWNSAIDYTILTAGGGVTGTFGTLSSSSAFLTPTLSYDPNNVYLKLTRNSNGFASIGLTSNQKNTGWGIETAGAGNNVYQQILGMSASQANNAYDNLSGEIHASAKSAMLTNSHYARSAVKQHLNGNSGLNSMQADSEKGVWINAWGHGGHLKADGNAGKLDNKGYGIMIGADVLSTTKTALGMALGYEQSDLKIGAARNSKADVDAIHLLIYGRTQVGAIDIKGGAGYSWLDANTTRHIAVGNIASKNEASYNGGLFQLFIEGGRTFQMGGAYRVTPYAGLAYQSIKTNGFTETGTAAQLQGDSSRDHMFSSTLGVRGDWQLGVKSNLYADLGWQHNFGGSAPKVDLNFAGAMRYNVKGVKMNSNSAIVGVGVNFELRPNMQLSAGYEGLFGNQSRSHTAKMQWRLSF